MEDASGLLAENAHGLLLLKWAKRYSPHAKYFQRIVERTTMMAVSDPDALLQGDWERNVKALMHRVAQDELLRIGEESEPEAREALQGAQVLVVEDEYVLATELAKALKERGAQLVGPCSDLESGLSASREQPIDVAILDIRLAGEDSYPIADELRERDIPFLFLSGYERDVLPTRYKDAHHYLKPMPTSEIPSLVSLFLSETRTK